MTRPSQRHGAEPAARVSGRGPLAREPIDPDPREPDAGDARENGADGSDVAAIGLGARHALRTPLHAILGSAELLLDTPLDDAQRVHVRTVLTSARDLHAAIGALLDPSESRQTMLADERSPTAGLRGDVLIVDDQPVNGRIAAGMLEPLGLRVDVAEGGLAAMAMLSQRAYDVVLTDVQMPDVDGIELTRGVRRLDGTLGRQTAVVALTADASADDRRRCLDAGMDDYLAKPVGRDALARTVTRWLPPTDAERSVTSSGTMPRDERLKRRLEPPIDPETLRELRAMAEEIGADLVGEVYELYLADASDRVKELRGHLEAGDTGALRRAAHTLCGSSGSVGARPLAELGRRLETSVDDVERAQLVSDIERESERVIEAMRAELTVDRRLSMPG